MIKMFYQDHDRDPGRLVVLSGRTGQMIGERYLEMPGSKETYMTPVMYHPPTGSDIILFGSGGETIAGQLDVLSLCLNTSFATLQPTCT